MDLNSLPDELMARVLNRASNPTIVRLRKMDSRIYAISKKFNVGNRMQVHSLRCELQVDRNGNSILHLMLRMDPFDDDFYFHIDATDNFKLFQIFLNKIQMKNRLTINALLMSINENLIGALLNQRARLRNIRFLALVTNEHSLTCSPSIIQKLVTSCPNLRYIRVNGDASSMITLCNEKVLGGRHWENIYIEEDYAFSHLQTMNKEFLYEVVKNCVTFEYDGRLTQFNGHEFMDFIEDCVEEKNFFTRQEWVFRHLPSSNYAEVIKRLKNIPQIESKMHRCSYYDSFQIRIPANPEVNIEFGMLRENR